MSLDLSSLDTAVNQLARVAQLAHDQEFMGAQEEVTVLAIRSGVIQHFDIVYELSWKFIQRWLRENTTPGEADRPRSRKDLFRAAADAGLVTDPVLWFGFGDARNITSHTYNEAHAEAVFRQASPLATEAAYLLQQLRATNA